MFNPNPNRRLSKRRAISLMVALTILAWATQTLFHQWGLGAQLRSGADDEKFIAPDSVMRGATLELRGEASVVGTEVRLKQICRWADADSAVLAPLSELVVMRFARSQPFRSVDVDQIKKVLADAGVNLGSINFTGTASCTISRADVKFDEHVALQQWIDARSGKELTETDPPPTTQPDLISSAIPTSLKTDPGANKPGVHTLRELLVTDIAQRLNLAPETLQVDFRPEDQKALNLNDAQFRFHIDPQRVRGLGRVEWLVTISATDDASQKVTIPASARAWQDQLVLARPLAFRQIIRDADLTERRALVDSLDNDQPATKSQAIGQQAARELKAGTLLTARMVDPIQLVKTGQYVTISVENGGVQVKTVARALEGGAFGQSIKVKNETTKDMFDVTVTGPQTATLSSPPREAVSEISPR